MNQTKPILFNTEMVRAILDGRKTVTRRLVKPQPVKDGRLWWLDGAAWTDNLDSVTPVPCHSLYNKSPFHPGDILYVRETWAKMTDLGTISHAGFVYRGDFNDNELHQMAKKQFVWKPSIHMPKEAARIFLRVTNVRVERLRNMVLADVLMEGITEGESYDDTWKRWHDTWNSTIKAADLSTKGWEANPWAWVIKFEQISKEESI